MTEQPTGAALPDPPAANQGKDEPIATTPSESPQSSDDRPSNDVGGQQATVPAHTTGGVPVPGDSQGVSVPSVQAAAGSSEESEQIEDVRIPSNAPPGKPDGEVDTRA